jgi:RND family efflux transporter MFP subunit
MPEPTNHMGPSSSRPAISNQRLRLVGIVALCVAGLVVVTGVVGRVMANQSLKTWSSEQAIPTVSLVSLKSGEADHSLILPGDVQAFINAPIHARVSGYLKRWYVDIGAPVKAGQLLAEVDTPDLDQQLAQAKADLATANANANLARTTATRWTGLLAQDAVSRQEADEKNGDLAAKASLANSARANVLRLQALESFKRITAPFPGVVTARNTDIGQLIAEGTPTAAPLFTVADEHRLRIYVHIPQSYIAQVRPGMTATMTVPEYPGRTFTATFVNSSGAVAAQTGSLLAELQIDNADHALKPGEYAQVTFPLPGQPGALRVPASALITRHDGAAVAVVGPGSRIQFRPITIVHDLGASVEIAGGLNSSDKVVDNPADTLQPGDLVRVAGASAEAHASAQHGAAHG